MKDPVSPTADDSTVGRRGIRPEDASGRVGGGESGGGSFKDDDLVPTKPGSFEGGQSQKKYTGGGDAEDGDSNPNAVTDH